MNSCPADRPSITLSTHADVREALRSKDLRQALYDDGALVMAGCLLDLHGTEHRDRRRLENRLFRRQTFEEYERQVIPMAIADALDPAIRVGTGDLVQIGYRSVMHLTAIVAGVDVPGRLADHLERIVKTFSRGATAVHATGDRVPLFAEVSAALVEFDDLFLQPSIARRRTALAIEQTDPEQPAPRDVLTTLLRNVDQLELPIDVIRREVAFYLQAGGHSTANALTHTMDELWSNDDPSVLAEARADMAMLQRCVHEALRLHPASPVAWRRVLEPMALRSGDEMAADTLLILDIEAANRDSSVWGDTAERFDPRRPTPDGVYAWGLSFGAGPHACIGMELDGGVPPTDDGSVRLYGTVTLLADALLAAGAAPDPASPPVIDPASARLHYARYPIVFGSR